MAKWFGIVGYVETTETRPGVWTSENSVTERAYYGDVDSNSRRLQTSDKVNDNINVSMEISIIADIFAYKNFHSIRYIEYMGKKWKVTNVSVQYPRLKLTIGDVYNGE